MKAEAETEAERNLSEDHEDTSTNGDENAEDDHDDHGGWSSEDETGFGSVSSVEDEAEAEIQDSPAHTSKLFILDREEREVGMIALLK